MDDQLYGSERPIEFIEDGGEGIGDGDVVVDEESVFISATVGDAPAHDFLRSGEDLGFTGGILAIRFGGNSVMKNEARVSGRIRPQGG